MILIDLFGLKAGDLLIAATIIFSAGGFYYVSRSDNRRMREDIIDIKVDMKMLAKVVTEQAVQTQRLDNYGERLNTIEKRTDERLAAAERRWEEVRRGEGMIVR